MKLLPSLLVALLANFNPATATEPTPSPEKIPNLPVLEGLVLDLDAAAGVTTEEENRIDSWQNQAANPTAEIFTKQDEGRKVAGSGRPTLKPHAEQIGGLPTVVFREQELINTEEDAFDHLVTGNGYTGSR